MASLPVMGSHSTGSEVHHDVLYLTSEQGPAGATGDPASLMQTELRGAESQVLFVPIADAILSPIPVIGDAVTDAAPVASEQVWSWNGTWSEDRRIVQDTIVTLWIGTQVSGNGVLSLSLADVAPDGRIQLVASHEYTISVGSPSSVEQQFSLDTSGTPLQEGHSLRLRMTLGGLSVSSQVDYGSQTYPSNVLISHEVLDTDGDGVSDTQERILGTNPKDPSDPGDARVDSDGDGLSDRLEAELGTDPFDPDSDGDGVGDGIEYHQGGDPLDPALSPRDRDGDGLPDDFEASAGTDPVQPDTDGDGTSDCDEDPDMDGLTNCQEAANGTDPVDPDSDGDGVLDGDEVTGGTDPLIDPIVLETDFGIWEVVGGSILFVTALALIGVGLFSRHAL